MTRMTMQKEQIRCAAVVLAAGSGSRMQKALSRERDASAAEAHGASKKQFLSLGGKPLICHSLAVFEAAGLIGDIILVTGKEDVPFCEKEIVAAYGFSKVRRVVAGGKERYHSVYAGLKALKDLQEDKDNAGKAAGPSYVMIHDGARPFVTEDILARAYQGVSTHGACVCAMPVKDTIKIADENAFVTETPDRRTLWQMQTPQAFAFDLIHDAYAALLADEAHAAADAHAARPEDDTYFSADAQGSLLGFFSRLTDDAMVVERYAPAQRIFLAEGAYTNIKITTPEDLAYAGALLPGT